MNADALRGTLTGDDALRPTVEGAGPQIIPTCSKCGAFAEPGWPRLCLRDWNARLLNEIQASIAERDRAYAEIAALRAPSNVGRAPEDAAAGSPQGAADQRR